MLGGTTDVTISPSHSISGISPRLTSCKVTTGDYELFAVHSFLNDVCFDSSRLNFQQTTFGQEIGFRMRTFRFTTGESSTDAQQQTVSCELHLEPSADIVEEQAADCSCYTEDGCRAWEPTGVDCWTECSNNGGSCSHCGQNGFCCRNWDGDSESGVPAANGNCPPNAIQAALTDRHQCVAPKQVGSCPSSHKYAYLNGQYCCQTKREKVGGRSSDLCDGSLISIGSECCENDAYARCSF